jgi:hypothetical protein
VGDEHEIETAVPNRTSKVRIRPYPAFAVKYEKLVYVWPLPHQPVWTGLNDPGEVAFRPGAFYRCGEGYGVHGVADRAQTHERHTSWRTVKTRAETHLHPPVNGTSGRIVR